jgi:hypothetical protein
MQVKDDVKDSEAENNFVVDVWDLVDFFFARRRYVNNIRSI